MLNLNEFSHNHHPSGVNLLAKYIRRGIWVILSTLPKELSETISSCEVVIDDQDPLFQLTNAVWQEIFSKR